MNIHISERAMKDYTDVSELFKAVDLPSELWYHESTHKQQPGKITIVKAYEDSSKLKPSKDHLVLTL